MSFPRSCHAAMEHCKLANFQERLLKKVWHNREENEASHPCDCQTTAEAGSNGSKILTDPSINTLNAHASRSRVSVFSRVPAGRDALCDSLPLAPTSSIQQVVSSS